MTFFQAIKKIFKNYMIAGTVVLVPLIGTYLILRFIIQSIDSLVISLLPSGLNPQNIFGVAIPGIGLIATIALILIVGVFTRLYIGKRIVSLGDKIISRIPFGRGIYGGIKQFLNTIVASDKNKFQNVVAVEFPHKGAWMIGFVTGEPVEEVQSQNERKMVNVFIPTTPNPTSGFLIMFFKEEVKYLPMGVDEAFKFIVSGGMVRE